MAVVVVDVRPSVSRATEAQPAIRQDGPVAHDIIEDLAWRGLIAQSTDVGALAEHLRERSAHPVQRV